MPSGIRSISGAVFFLAFFVFSPCIPVLAQEKVDFEVPAPPNSRMVLSQPVSSSGETGSKVNYQSSLSLEGVTKFYQSFFKGRGFELVSNREAGKGLFRNLEFRKEGVLVSLTLFGNRYGTNVIVGKLAQPQDAPGQQAVLTGSAEELSRLAKIVHKIPQETISPQISRWEIPVPRETSLTGTEAANFLGRDTLVSAYSSTQDPAALGSFYQSYFKKQGFTLQEDLNLKESSMRRMRFKKGELVADVMLSGKQKGTDINLLRYIQPKGMPDIEKDPQLIKSQLAPLAEDRPGNDLEGIPRPPQSVRIGNILLGAETTVGYTTPLSPEAARKFYLAQMPRNSWNLVTDFDTAASLRGFKQATGKSGIEEASPPEKTAGIDVQGLVNKSYYMIFQGRQGVAEVTVFPNLLNKDSGSTVTINLKKAGD